MLQDPEAALAAQVRLRIGAPIGTWAGASNGVEEAFFESTHGVFEMALLQARLFSRPRQARPLTMPTSATGRQPTLPSAPTPTSTRATIAPFPLWHAQRPFADERYDDVSLNARVGWVMAHELGW